MYPFERVFVVIPRHKEKMKPFYAYMDKIIGASLNDLGIENKIFLMHTPTSTRDFIRQQKKAVVIFLMSPNMFCFLKRPKRQSVSIMWNFEPFVYWMNSGAKNTMNNFLGGQFDYLWLYDKNASESFNSHLVSWVPCGFHKCITSPQTNNRMENILFLGNKTGIRRRFIDTFDRLSETPIVQNVNKYKNIETHLEEIERFKYTVYTPVLDGRDIFVPAHRIILFAALKVLIFSNVNLEPMLSDRQEYIYFDNEQDLCDKYRFIQNNSSIYNSIVNNAYDKIVREFSMINMLKREFEKFDPEKFKDRSLDVHA